MIVGTLKNFDQWLGQQTLCREGATVIVAKSMHSLRISLPQPYAKLLCILDTLLPTHRLKEAGLMVWDETIWSEIQSVTLFDRLRCLIDDSDKKLEDWHFTEFVDGDYDDLYTFSVIVAQGQWEAILVSKLGNHIVQFEHDGFLTLSTADPDDFTAMRARLNEIGVEHENRIRY